MQPNKRVRIPSGGTSTTMPNCPSRRSTGAYATYGTAPGSSPSNCTTDRAFHSSSKSGCSEPRYSIETMLFGCVTWNPRACHYDTLRRAHHSFLTRYIGWWKNNRADHPIYYLDTLTTKLTVCVLFCFVSLETSFFSSIFVPLLPFSLCVESIYVVRLPLLPDDVFLPCDNGLDF